MKKTTTTKARGQQDRKEAVRAEKASGFVSVLQLTGKVTAAMQGDERFKSDRGYSYCCDIVINSGQLFAVVERWRDGNSDYAKVGITANEDGSVTIAAGELQPSERTTVYAAQPEAEAKTPKENPDVVHCRAVVGAAISAKSWKMGAETEFMWMPAGTHTICAGFRDGGVELTVKCDEKTAEAVQASLEQWRDERPKQEPFGCIEHREHEASVRVTASCGFKFKDDGVYLSAEPTKLGAENVNGKIHRSWSPSFFTDADYDAAEIVTAKDGSKTLTFPDGVRGSKSNPAEIIGVDFCVGTLTNKPAFHEIAAVTATERQPADKATASQESASTEKTGEQKPAKPTLEQIYAKEGKRQEQVKAVLAKSGRAPVTLESIYARRKGTMTVKPKTPAKASEPEISDELKRIYARAGGNG